VGKRQSRAYVTVKQSAGTAGIACKGKKASFNNIIILPIYVKTFFLALFSLHLKNSHRKLTDFSLKNLKGS
jgi:hypothetical protein